MSILGITFAEFSWSPFMLVGMDLPTLICTMMIYSFIGWVYESTIFSILEQGKIMNRGCFIGPYLPIYSVAAIACLYLFSDITSPFKIVVMGALVVSAIEYITSWALEKIFHARYWDYSYYPLNINGRISVFSGIFFGIAMLFLIKILHPVVSNYLFTVKHEIKVYLSIAFFIIFLLDVVFTTIAMCNLNKKCKALYDAWDGYVESKLDKINEKKAALDKYMVVVKGKQLVFKIKGVNAKFVDLEARYLKSKSFKSTKYGIIVEKIKDSYRNTRYRKMISYDDVPEEVISDEMASEQLVSKDILSENGGNVS